MEGLGYGPTNRLKVKVATRDFASYKDPAVILVDQLNKIYFDAEMELVESSIWHSRLTKKDYTVGMNTSGVGIDDPDAVLKGAYACKSEANYTGYCRPEDREAARRAVAGSRSSTSGARSSGRSSASWPRTWRARSSITTAPPPAGTRTSRATCTRRTASTTTGASTRSGSTSKHAGHHRSQAVCLIPVPIGQATPVPPRPQ